MFSEPTHTVADKVASIQRTIGEVLHLQQQVELATRNSNCIGQKAYLSLYEAYTNLGKAIERMSQHATDIQTPESSDLRKTGPSNSPAASEPQIVTPSDEIPLSLPHFHTSHIPEVGDPLSFFGPLLCNADRMEGIDHE